MAAKQSLLVGLGIIPSDASAVKVAVERIVDAYIRATKNPVCKDRLDKFVLCLSEAAAAASAADPEIDRLLQAAQREFDDRRQMIAPSTPLATPALDEVAKVFKAFGWTGPYWPDPPRSVAGTSADSVVNAALKAQATAAAQQNILDDWANIVWQRRSNYLSA